MNLASTRLVARDIKTLTAFYERLTGITADWLAPQFSEIVTPSATLAIGAAETIALFREGSAEPCANRSAILEFRVEDVEALHARMEGTAELVHPPKMMPWGNLCVQYRDPEGTLISLFQPATEAARARFATRQARVTAERRGR